jgi:hypothetical protein
MDDHRLLLVGIVEGRHPQHRPTVGGVVKGDPIHDSAQSFGYDAWLSDYGVMHEDDRCG